MIMIMWGLTCPVHDSARWNVEVDSNINTNPSIHCTGLQTTCSCVTLQTFCLWLALTRSPDCWAGPCWAAMKKTSQCTGPGWSRWSGLDSLIQPRSPEACGTDTLQVEKVKVFQFIWPWRRRTQTSSRAEKHWNVTRKRSSLRLNTPSLYPFHSLHPRTLPFPESLPLAVTVWPISPPKSLQFNSPQWEISHVH